MSDSHIGAGLEHRKDALTDTDAVLDQIIDRALEYRVDLLVHAGDLFHRNKPSPPELHVAKRFFDRLADEHIPSVLIHGNGSHSAALNIASAEELFASPWLIVSRRPEVISRNLGVSICTLPAVPMAQLVAQGTADRDEVYAQATDLLLRTARDLYDEAPADRPRILLAHWAVSGASLPTGLPVDQLGEIVLPLWALEEIGYDAIVLGHIHKAQELAEGIFYCGSPMCIDFGEANEPHGVTLLDVSPDVRGGGGEMTDFFALEDRRFVTIDCDLTEEPVSVMVSVENPRGLDEILSSGKIDFDETDVIAGAIAAEFPLTDAIVRVRYRATEEHHRRIDHQALTRLLDDAGAHRVYGGIQWEPVRETRVRAAGVDVDTLSPMAALDLWIAATDVPEPAAGSLRAMLGGWEGA